MARGRIPYIQLARGEILRYFEKSRQRVFSENDLGRVLAQGRDEWRLPQRMTVGRFIEFLEAKGRLQRLSIESAKQPGRLLTRYGWGEPSVLEVALSLKKRSYLCHASAAFVQGLTDQLPRRVYANFEQASEGGGSGLSQNAIHAAFRRQQRQTSLIFSYGEREILLLNGKNTGRLEVSSMEFDNYRVSVTKLERTLIDLAVRPAYGGGVYQVIEAFERARERVAFPVLLATLKRLNYVYPYHQAIGFYLERTGYAAAQYERLRGLGLKYDFYLAHAMQEKRFVPEWRLYVPKDL